METDRLEEVCKQLRLSHIPRVIETEGLKQKKIGCYTCWRMN